MTHIITRLCLRDTACVDVCPVECMILGQPEVEWPWLYIDPDTCIDCGACVPECPYEAIFPEEEVPYDYGAPPGVWINDLKELLPDGQLQGGEVLDLTEDIPPNYDFFSKGPGYDALDR